MRFDLTFLLSSWSKCVNIYIFFSMIFPPTGKPGGNKGEGLILIFFPTKNKISNLLLIQIPLKPHQLHELLSIF